jgi:hypothetical protein
MRCALVVDGRCCGFVLARRHQFEALDADEKSLGLFETEDAAAAAILNPLPTKELENART